MGESWIAAHGVSVTGRTVNDRSQPLHPDTMLGIGLSTICSRNRYETATAPVTAELLEVAGDRGELLAMEAGGLTLPAKRVWAKRAQVLWRDHKKSPPIPCRSRNRGA